jgi:hypothetical protein
LGIGDHFAGDTFVALPARSAGRLDGPTLAAAATGVQQVDERRQQSRRFSQQGSIGVHVVGGEAKDLADHQSTFFSRSSTVLTIAQPSRHARHGPGVKAGMGKLL